MGIITKISLLSPIVLALIFGMGCAHSVTFYKGFQVLQQPVGDPNIVGKNIIFGTHIGQGSESTKYPSLTTYMQSEEGRGFGDIEVPIKQVLIARLGLSTTKYSHVELKDIEILKAKDLKSLAVQGGDRVVIEAILVGSLEIYSYDGFDATAKAQLAELGEIITKAKATATVEGGQAFVKLGKGLIVAVKVLEFRDPRVYSNRIIIRDRIGKEGNLEGKYYQVELSSLNYPTQVKEIDENTRDHIFCVAVSLVDPLERASSDSPRKWLPYCPAPGEIVRVWPEGNRYEQYSPMPRLQSHLPVPIMNKFISDEFILVSLQVNSVSTEFHLPNPEASIDKRFAQLRDADGEIEVIETHWRISLANVD